MTNKEALESACNPGHDKEIFQHPWLCLHEGYRCGFAADGIMGLFIKGETDWPALSSERWQVIASHFQYPVKNSSEIRLTDLITFCTLEQPDPCPKCGLPCPLCAEKHIDAMRPGVYKNTMFNRRHLSKTLPLLDGRIVGGMVNIATSDSRLGADTMFRVYTNDWSVFLMGLIETRDFRLEDAVRLELAVSDALPQDQNNSYRNQ